MNRQDCVVLMGEAFCSCGIVIGRAGENGSTTMNSRNNGGGKTQDIANDQKALCERSLFRASLSPTQAYTETGLIKERGG